MPTAKKKTAAKAAEPVGAAMAAGQETFETAIQAGAEAFKGYEDVVGYGKDSVDAVMKSNALFVKGFQEILDGKHDNLPEQAFYMVGTIDKATEKAKTMKAAE